MEIITTILPDGRLLIPARFRKELKLKSGDEVILRIEGRSLRLIPLEEAVTRAQNLVKNHTDPGVSLVDALLEDRKTEAANDPRCFCCPRPPGE